MHTNRMFFPTMTALCLTVTAFACGECMIPTDKPDAGTSTDAGPARIRASGPGRMTAKVQVVSGATRVRDPALWSTEERRRSGSVTQGLSVNFNGAAVQFDTFYYAEGPQYLPILNDAGMDEGFATRVNTPRIIKILPNGSQSDFYLFTDDDPEALQPGHESRFKTGYGGTVEREGVTYREFKYLMLPLATDADGNVYFGSNASLELLKFTPEGVRSSLMTLPAPPTSLTVAGTRLYVMLLPRLDAADGMTVLHPARMMSYALDGTDAQIVAELPSDVELYRSNSQEYAVDGGSFRSPLSLPFALTSQDEVLFLSSPLNGKVYRKSPDAGIEEYATGLFGVTSITACPTREALYAFLPTYLGSDGETFMQYPQIVAISPLGEKTPIVEFSTEYQGISPAVATNTFGSSINGLVVGVAAMPSLTADTNCNLIASDLVRETITAIMMEDSLDAGVAEDAGMGMDAGTDMDAGVMADAAIP